VFGFISGILFGFPSEQRSPSPESALAPDEVVDCTLYKALKVHWIILKKQNRFHSFCTTAPSRRLTAALEKAPSEPCLLGAASSCVHSNRTRSAIVRISASPLFLPILYVRVKKFCALLPQCCDKVRRSGLSTMQSMRLSLSAGSGVMVRTWIR